MDDRVQVAVRRCQEYLERSEASLVVAAFRDGQSLAGFRGDTAQSQFSGGVVVFEVEDEGS